VISPEALVMPRSVVAPRSPHNVRLAKFFSLVCRHGFWCPCFPAYSTASNITKHPCTKPAARFLTKSEQLVLVIRSQVNLHAKMILTMGNEKYRKPYVRPTATKLTSQEAKFKLVEHARKGDQEAMHLLEIMFPEEAKRLSKSTKKSA